MKRKGKIARTTERTRGLQRASGSTALPCKGTPPYLRLPTSTSSLYFFSFISFPFLSFSSRFLYFLFHCTLKEEEKIPRQPLPPLFYRLA